MTTRTLSVALLRGINVGGKHRVPMADLRELFAQGGFPGAQTYIQSGNVVFAGDVAGAARARVAARLAAVAQRTFGFPVPFVLRTARELAAIAGNNPFLAEGEDPSALHVVFASGPISARARARSRSRPFAAGPFSRGRRRRLPALPQRRRAHEADDRLVRCVPAVDDDGAQLAHGPGAARARVRGRMSARARAHPAACRTIFA
jgi:hypothetical protein